MLNCLKNTIKKNNAIYNNYIKIYNLKFNILSYINFKRNGGSNKIKAYKDKHIGKRCFIIGNGPSLNIEDLEKIKNEYSMAANRIYTIYSDTVYRPTYYFAQDQTIIKENILDIKKIKEIKFIRSMEDKSYDDISFNKFYINNFRYLSRKAPNFSEQLEKCVYDGYTVTYSMIQFACYMGFKEIYLLGVDFSYHLTDGKIDKDSYFNSKLFDKKKIGGAPDVDYNLMAYKVAKSYSENNKVKIFNATRGGKLEVFERINFDELKFD